MDRRGADALDSADAVGRISRSLSNQPTQRKSFVEQAIYEAKGFFLTTKLNVLLVTFPFAIIAYYGGWGDAATFILSCLALVPLAERLGWITEQLANYTNDTLGGLLNASFGNATEMIISGFALAKGTETYLRVVQLSLLGSIISNLLLVLGSAFIAGGIKNKAQSFNQAGVNINCGLLMLAVITILMPSLLSETHTEAKGTSSELTLSRIESICMLLCYILFLFFQLYTHRHLYEEEDKEPPKELPPKNSDEFPHLGMQQQHQRTLSRERELDLEGGGSGGIVPLEVEGPLRKTGSMKRKKETEETASLLAPGGASPGPGSLDGRGDADKDDEEEEEQYLTKVGCFVWLALTTVCISILSEFITDAIIGASKSTGIPMPFLCTIVLPIVGNAAEHASALIFAYRNRMEIALGVALGSATQVATLVVPFTVVLAWMMGRPLDLNFNAFEAFILTASVLIVVVIVMDGQANYLKGTLLVATFFFMSVGFWCHKDADLTDFTPDRRLS